MSFQRLTQTLLCLSAAFFYACGSDDDDDNGQDSALNGQEDGGSSSDASQNIQDGQSADQDATSDAGTVIELPYARFEVSEEIQSTPLAMIPWPSDLYRDGGGHLKIPFAHQPKIPLLDNIITAIEESTGGFGTSSTLYLSCDGEMDLSKLPADAASSMLETSSLQLINIDRNSNFYGERLPLIWKFRDSGTQYLPSNTLYVRLLEGFVLRPSTKYALVLSQSAAKPAQNFLEALKAERPEGLDPQVWQNFAPLRDYLSEHPLELATASVFTTQDPVGELFRLQEYVNQLPAPVIITVESKGIREGRPDDFELFTGTYQAPRFQKGEIPYEKIGEGEIIFDDQGTPVVQGEETLRFALSVPLTQMPEGGWPVVLFAHGTGGSYTSFVSNEVADFCAAQGLAVLSMDQIHHGPRSNGACSNGDKTCVTMKFFNFLVPKAARDNLRQSAVDLISLMKLARNFSIPENVSVNGGAVQLNPQKVGFMGHSQGSLNGPLFLAVEPSIPGGVLSGGGADLALSLEQKKEPYDMSKTISGFLQLPSSDAIDRWHPVMMFLQMFIEPGDAINYAQYWFDNPPEGYKPKNLFMTSGLEDLYTPHETANALAAAGRVPIIGEMTDEIPALTLLGISTGLTPPISGNVAHGKASAGYAQFEKGDHYVVFDDRSVRRRYINFLVDLLSKKIPSVY